MFLLVFGTLSLMACATLGAVFLPERAPSVDELYESYDDVDKAWLHNAVIMPEIAPVAPSNRQRIVNTRPGLQAIES